MTPESSFSLQETALALLVLVTCSSLYAQPLNSKPEGSADKSPAHRALATARRDVLAELWRLRSYQLTHRLDSDFYLLDVLPKLLAAEQELAQSKQERIAALQNQLVTLEQAERTTKQRYEQRYATIADLAAVQANRAGVEQQELETLARAVTLAKAHYQKGTGTFDLVSDATNQLYAARIATASTAEQRAELLQGYYNWSVELEDRARTGYEQGTATRTELLEASERRFSIQMAQLRPGER